MLLIGIIILLVGFLFAWLGFQAMKDPNKPLNRAGGYRVFTGTALMVSGLGMSVLDLVA